VFGSLFGFLGAMFGAGFITDSDNETGFPWYVDFLLTFLFALAGIVIALAVLTRVGFLTVVTDFLKSYMSFIGDIFKAIAEPLVKIFV